MSVIWKNGGLVDDGQIEKWDFWPMVPLNKQSSAKYIYNVCHGSLMVATLNLPPGYHPESRPLWYEARSRAAMDLSEPSSLGGSTSVPVWLQLGINWMESISANRTMCVPQTATPWHTPQHLPGPIQTSLIQHLFHYWHLQSNFTRQEIKGNFETVFGLHRRGVGLYGRFSEDCEWSRCDNQLSMKEHVQRGCTTAYYHLRQLRSIWGSLSADSCSTLVWAFITSRIDYCNSLLAGVDKSEVGKLQSILHVAACLIMQKRKLDPISNDIRDKLHWLPVEQRIQFKIGVLAYTDVSMEMLHPTYRRCSLQRRMSLALINCPWRLGHSSY